MSRKDYKLIAEAISNARVKLTGAIVFTRDEVIVILAIELSHRLAMANPDFNRAKFLKACGIKAS